MGKPGRGAKPRRGSQISSVKKNNKSVAKLDKQGKKKRGGKKHQDKKRKRETESEKAHYLAVRERERAVADDERNGESGDDEDDDGVQSEKIREKDLQYFASSAANLSFLSPNFQKNLDRERDKQKSGKKRKSEDDDDDDERCFEMHPRSFNEATTEDDGGKVRMLLPVKDKHRLIRRIGEKVEEEEEEIEEEEMEEVLGVHAPAGLEDDEGFESGSTPSKDEEEGKEPMTLLESLVWRRKQIGIRKQRIALLCTSIMERPEERMGKLKELRLLLNETDGRLIVTVKKLVMLSLLEIFKDVVPSYRIRSLTETEKGQRMKKETLALVDFEEGLLKNYRLYLVELENCIKNGLNKKRSKMSKDDEEDETEVEEKSTAFRNLAFMALKCMCELLVAHPHFNYRTNIVTVIVPLMGFPDDEVSCLVCDTIRKVFKVDNLGDVSYEIVKTLGSELKARQHSWPRRTLDVCLSLRIRNDLSERQDDKAKERKKRYEAYKKLMKYASRKEKKRKKKMAELENQLKATEATQNVDACLEWHTKTITQLFAIYFRILKKGRATPLLGATLAGLSNFAHLINLDFFDDLLSNLHSIVATHKGLTFENSLHCVHTTFAILSGQGSALNIDPMRFYGQLYKDLVDETSKPTMGNSSTTTPLMLKCIYKMIIARSKQVSIARLLAFTKRLCTIALQQDHSGAVAMLAMVRKLLLCSPKTDILYENEGTGSGVYLAEMEDPEYCKPEATALWDLHAVRRHYHPVASSLASKILQHHPLQPEHKLTPELSLKDPSELFFQFSPSGETDFRPPLLPPPPQKLRDAFKKKSGKHAIFRVHRFADSEFGAKMARIADGIEIEGLGGTEPTAETNSLTDCLEDMETA